MCADIAGKNIIIYKPEREYSPGELETFLRKYKLCDALRLIGQKSNQIFNTRDRNEKNSILNRQEILAYLAMNLILNSNDYRSRDFKEEDLNKARNIYLGIPDPFETNNENPESYLIRLGMSQFDYDREFRNLIPRTLILYQELWQNRAQTKSIDLKEILNNLYNLDLEQIIFFGFLFKSKSERGFFRMLKKSDIEEYDRQLTYKFDWSKQEPFLKRISSNYKSFRDQAEINHKSNSFSKNPLYNKFRFNPLLKIPIITPDRNLKPGFSQIYITPIPHLIMERVTRGLYFDFADYFKQGRSNSFRTAFGSVFQDYIGLLLEKQLGKERILAEFEYYKGHEKQDSPDWFIILGDRMIIIEVKQSCLYLDSKQWGDLKQVKKDLNKTIGKAANQLFKFEMDIRSNKYQELARFQNIKSLEKLVVIHDSVYFLNDAVRNLVKQLNPNIPQDYHWHTISIADFEYFLGIAGDRIFDLLEQKRLNRNEDTMDFRDYYTRKYSQEEITNPYLRDYYNNWFDKLGLKRDN